jgi:hypothetical protein
MHAFLNRQTGELYGATDDQIARAELDDDDLLDWEAEIVHRLRAILESRDWLELPRRDSHQDYRIMERFCLEQSEGCLQEELLIAIKGRGAFIRFKSVVHWHGIHEAWYAFRRDCVAKDAMEWLEANQIAFKP